MTQDIRPLRRDHFLAELTQKMNHHSALGIGQIHRFLTQPLNSGEDALGLQARLRKNLQPMTQDALTYVCVDLDLLPPAKPQKAQLIDQLVDWVRLCDNLEPTILTNLAHETAIGSFGTCRC